MLASVIGQRLKRRSGSTPNVLRKMRAEKSYDAVTTTRLATCQCALATAYVLADGWPLVAAERFVSHSSTGLAM